MTISLRLEPQLSSQLEAAAARQGVSKSELIRQCVEEYLLRHENRPTAWDLGKKLFGKAGSGRGDLAANRKQIVKAKLNAKSNRR